MAGRNLSRLSPKGGTADYKVYVNLKTCFLGVSSQSPGAAIIQKAALHIARRVARWFSYIRLHRVCTGCISGFTFSSHKTNDFHKHRFIMLRTTQKTFNIALGTIVVVFLSLLAGCSSGIGDDLHPNKGPGLYRQTFDIEVSHRSSIVLRIKTSRHEHVFVNSEKHHTAQPIRYDIEKGKTRVDISSDKDNAETGLEVTLEVYASSSAPLHVKTVAYGYLNGNKISTIEDAATFPSGQKRTVVMGLGDLER